MDSETVTSVNEAAKNQYDQFPYKQITDADIEKHGLKWLMRDELTDDMEDDVYIYNMDSSNNAGSHWVCFALQYPAIFYYDPFSVKLGGYPPKDLRLWGKKQGYRVIYCNDQINQPIKSNLCGYFSLYIADKLKESLGTLTEKKFDSIIASSFDKSPTKSNVSKITKWSKKEHLL